VWLNSYSRYIVIVYTGGHAPRLQFKRSILGKFQPTILWNMHSLSQERMEHTSTQETCFSSNIPQRHQDQVTPLIHIWQGWTLSIHGAVQSKSGGSICPRKANWSYYYDTISWHHNPPRASPSSWQARKIKRIYYPPRHLASTKKKLESLLRVLQHAFRVICQGMGILTPYYYPIPQPSSTSPSQTCQQGFLIRFGMVATICTILEWHGYNT